MAFTGTAVISQVSDRKIRITGLSLAAGASGTIALHSYTGSPTPGVTLPVGFQPDTYTNSEGAQIQLQDSISIQVNLAATVATAVPMFNTKIGTDPTDFLMTVGNGSGGTASPALEIIVEFH